MPLSLMVVTSDFESDDPSSSLGEAANLKEIKCH